MDPTPYVDEHYVADSAYEYIVFGDGLRDGMIVLIESSTMRADPARVDERNRWCEVSDVRITAHAKYPTVRFIGHYPDGTMRVRTYGVAHAWIVKRQPNDDRSA